jgi:ribosomal-protein-alanine N-acetyltransferase
VALEDEAIPIGLVTVDEHASEGYEVSYMFHPESWGLGYAREAVRAVLTWAVDEVCLQRVIAVTQSRNVRSLALLAHVGMSPEREIVEHGEPQTVLSFHAESKASRWP